MCAKMGNWISFLDEPEKQKPVNVEQAGIESFSEGSTEESDEDIVYRDRTRYAIITPKGVVRFWVNPDTLEIKYQRITDAYYKITTEWTTASVPFKEMCTIEKDQNGEMWYHIELSDPYYGCPKYYVWDTYSNTHVGDHFNNIETNRVLNMV